MVSPFKQGQEFWLGIEPYAFPQCKCMRRKHPDTRLGDNRSRYVQRIDYNEVFVMTFQHNNSTIISHVSASDGGNPASSPALQFPRSNEAA
jgi:hypothetical protein